MMRTLVYFYFNDMSKLCGVVFPKTALKAAQEASIYREWLKTTVHSPKTALKAAWEISLRMAKDAQQFIFG